MAARNKLSLTAQFDDICRNENELLAQYQELAQRLPQFLESFASAQCNKVNQEYNAQIKRYEDQINDLMRKNKKLSRHVSELQSAHKVILQRKNSLAKDKDVLKKRLITAAAFLSDSTFEGQYKASERQQLAESCRNVPLISESCDGDTTDISLSELEVTDDEDRDLVDQSTYTPTTHRKMKLDENASLRSEDTDTLKGNSSFISRSSASSLSTINETIVNEATVIAKPPRAMQKYESDVCVSGEFRVPSQISTFSLRGPVARRIITRESATSALSHRPHKFVEKTCLSRNNVCSSCRKGVSWLGKVLICEQCLAFFHVACRATAPVPCEPKVNFKPGQKTLLTDYAPEAHPRVPTLIFNCTAEIERRGLAEKDLYHHRSGSFKEENDLYDKMMAAMTSNKSTKFPDISKVSVHVLCDIIKKFLRKLDDSLLTGCFRRGFIFAASARDVDSLKQDVNGLPIANKHTVAYLMIHLKTILQTEYSQTSIKGLSLVFGPIIVGYSIQNLPLTSMESENRQLADVVEQLLGIELSFWADVLNSGQVEAKSSKKRESKGGILTANGAMTPHVKALKMKPIFGK